jgi:hypothetical protein
MNQSLRIKNLDRTKHRTIHVYSHLSNLPTFMVTAQNCNAIPVPNFQGNQQGNSL